MWSNFKWAVSSWVVSTIFFLDFVCEFLTATKDEHSGHLLITRKEIARQYLRSGWLIIDFIAMIPVVAFADTSQSKSNEAETWTSFRTLTSFAMLFKLSKLAKYEINFSQDVIKQQHHNKYTRLLKISIYLLMTLHIFACFWHRLGQKDPEDTPILDSGDYAGTWLDNGQLRNTTVKRRYISSVYFIITTLTSVGYGDYSSQNESEEVSERSESKRSDK